MFEMYVVVPFNALASLESSSEEWSDLNDDSSEHSSDEGPSCCRWPSI